MVTQIQFGDVTVDVSRKKIKNLHLRICRRTGTVGVSAPMRMPLTVIRLFVLSKHGWIKQQQVKLQSLERAPIQKYCDQETHWIWGKSYTLHVVHAEGTPSIWLEEDRMILSVRAGTTVDQKQKVIDVWYRGLVQAALPELIRKWEPALGVKVCGCTVRQMKTRWGSCTPRSGRIRINSELAKKQPECLEYIVVHEMVHLLEPSHNQRFVALMNQFFPRWKSCHLELNRRPI